MHLRNREVLFWNLAFPILLLVIFASLNAGSRLGALGGISYNQYYVPGIAAFGVISACYTQLAIARRFGQPSVMGEVIAGVLLVFSYLIVPAAVASLVTASVPRRLLIGWSVGALVSAAGLWASPPFAFGWPTSPSRRPFR